MRRNNYGRHVLFALGLLCLLSACDSGVGQVASSPHKPHVQAPQWWLSLWGLSSQTGHEAISDTAEKAQQWLALDMKSMHAQTQLEPSRLDEQLQNPDRRLARTVAPVDSSSPPVFVGLNAGSAKAVAPDEASTRLKERLMRVSKRLLDDIESTRDVRPVQPLVKAGEQATPELNQADAQQIKYMGLMRVGETEFGLVRVGERVYRITPDMRIGRGQWRIAQMDARTMQLVINGQTVNYGK